MSKTSSSVDLDKSKIVGYLETKVLKYFNPVETFVCCNIISEIHT